MLAEAPAPPLRDSGVATVDSSVHPTAEVVGRPVPLDAWAVGPASRVPDSTDRRRGGSRSVAAPCRGAIPVAVRIGAAADGNCHRVVPDRGTAAEAGRVGHPAGRARDPAPAPPIGRTAVPRARCFPPRMGSGHDLARQSRQAGARAPEAWGRGRFGLRCRRLVVGFFGTRPAELFPQCVVAVGHCTISFGVRRRGCRPLSSINYTGSAPSHTADRGAPRPASKHALWVAIDDDGTVTDAGTPETGG
jgi:hypothetical protein